MNLAFGIVFFCIFNKKKAMLMCLIRGLLEEDKG